MQLRVSLLPCKALVCFVLLWWTPMSLSNEEDTQIFSHAFTLNDGRSMPKVGLGVYRAEPGQETYQAVRWALDVGYRLIDTAAVYGNEDDVGTAIADSNVPREEIFLTTKIGSDSHGYVNALDAAHRALTKLKTSYVDLLLIHSPYGERIVETWDALVQLQRQGKARSIGVSNFGIPHLQALKEYGRPTPAVNQIELHPLNYKERKELVDFCQNNNIVITAYGSLFSGHTDRFQDPLLHSLAAKYRKTVPQILLRWALDKRFAVIPKSASSKQRIEENFAIMDFALTQAEVQSIADMTGPPLNEYWDPVSDAGVDIGQLNYGGDDRRSSEDEL